ncbi:MAG TPA: MBL fold metallo-hydrolase [Spirochaetota bacterium]|nr:MBL fold metallo-hydrolase [Spirochaetota bacterium]HPU90028.1 MBL fold metallo-hydrolase [Spirochaetota bacterium]
MRRPDHDIDLFDARMMGLDGLCAVYVLRGSRNVLIDAGTRDCAPALIDFLRDARIVPHIVVVTHNHHDHIGAIAPLRKAFGPIEVLCGPGGRERLRDPNAINRLFSPIAFEPIEGVTELADGETVDCGSRRLRALHTPGHSDDSISVIDLDTKTLFPGDLPGDWLWGHTFLSAHITPDFSEEKYFASTERLAALDIDSSALAHYGFFDGPHARSILQEQKTRYLEWRDALVPAYRETGNTHALVPILKRFLVGSRFESVPGYDAVIEALAGWCVMGYLSAGIIE